MRQPAEDTSSQPYPEPHRSSAGPGASQRPAVLGTTIAVRGQLAGQEDLFIEGRFEGEVRVPGHRITVGPSGRVEAEMQAQVIVIEGELFGNLVAERQAIVRSGAKVHGDIRSPTVVLEEGCQFRGTIDMEPKRALASTPPESGGGEPGKPGEGPREQAEGKASGQPELFGGSKAEEPGPGRGPGQPGGSPEQPGRGNTGKSPDRRR